MVTWLRGMARLQSALGPPCVSGTSAQTSVSHSDLKTLLSKSKDIDIPPGHSLDWSEKVNATALLIVSAVSLSVQELRPITLSLDFS